MQYGGVRVVTAKREDFYRENLPSGNLTEKAVFSPISQRIWIFTTIAANATVIMCY